MGSSDISSLEGIKGLFPPVALGVFGGTTFFSSGFVAGTVVAGFFFSSAGFGTAV